MRQYLDLMKEVLQYGELKEQARPGMPRTLELFGRMMKFNLREGFPLLTTKKMHYKGIIAELLWFLSGSTNVFIRLKTVSLYFH
ncbi:MAG: thymidylate synthase, partial [Erysipelotrichia bacterium]|nr:thymidylate synthase [Erysipelotrichia bacterium]